jgi:hypothetical protein
MRKYGRTPDQMKILPELTAVVAPTTEAEANEKWSYPPVADSSSQVGLDYLSMLLATDLSGFDPDDKFPELKWVPTFRARACSRAWSAPRCVRS